VIMTFVSGVRAVHLARAERQEEPEEASPNGLAFGPGESAGWRISMGRSQRGHRTFRPTCRSSDWIVSPQAQRRVIIAARSESDAGISAQVLGIALSRRARYTAGGTPNNRWAPTWIVSAAKIPPWIRGLERSTGQCASWRVCRPTAQMTRTFGIPLTSAL
jgi:hypothetical protein